MIRMIRSILTSSLLMVSAAPPALSRESPRLSAEDLRGRLEVSGEIFVLDATGKRLESVAATKNFWRGSGNAPLEANWGNRGSDYGGIYLRHAWTVQPDGTIAVRIEEYARQEDDQKRTFKDLLKREDLTLVDFAPVTWKVQNNKQKRVIVRLTPSLRERRETQLLAELPIAGINVSVSDNQGYLWTDGSSFDGHYVGLTTHRGTLALSFRSFPGAEEVGEAWDREIVVRLPGDLRVKLRSDTAFLPDKVGAKVFGLYSPDKKATHPRSTHVSTSSTEAKFLENLRR